MSTKWCKCTRKGNTYLPFALHVYSWVPKCHLPELFWVFGLFENYQISFQQSRKKIYTCRYIFIFSKREENGNTKMTRMKELCPLTHSPFHREKTSVGVPLFCGIPRLKKERCTLFQITINSKADLDFDYK